MCCLLAVIDYNTFGCCEDCLQNNVIVGACKVFASDLQVFSQPQPDINTPTASPASLKAASHVAFLNDYADSEGSQRKLQQVGSSPGRIVTSLSSVTQRHLRQGSWSSVTGSHSP